MTFDNPDFIIKLEEDAVSRQKLYTLRRYKGTATEVIVPDGVEKIASYAFADDIEPNTTIEKIILPDSVEDISKVAFSHCNALKEIQFPHGITNFEVSFEHCPSLEEVWIPESVTRFGNLQDTDSLKKVHIGQNITQINFTSFGRESKLSFLRRKTRLTEFLLQNPAYKIIAGFMVNTLFKTVLYRADCTKAEMRIPDGMEAISGGTFYELTPPFCSTPIKKVVIPESVKKIRNLAFHCCNELQEIRYEGNRANLESGEIPFYMCAGFHNDGSDIICKDSPEQKSKKTRPSWKMIERIKFINLQLKNRSYPNTDDLLELCRKRFEDPKLSKSTISRTIEHMKDDFGAPIEYSREQNGYYYSDDAFELDFERLFR